MRSSSSACTCLLMERLTIVVSVGFLFVVEARLSPSTLDFAVTVFLSFFE